MRINFSEQDFIMTRASGWRWTVHQSTFILLALAALSTFGSAAACGDGSTSTTEEVTPTAGASAREPETIPAPSFDACYPWMNKGTQEPPLFQLSASYPPAVYLLVIPGSAIYAGSEKGSGWKSDFADAEFAPLWELGKMARKRHAKGEDLTDGDMRTYLMSIGCGDYYQWHVLITEAFAETGGDDPAAELARQLFSLVHNPPANATR